MVRPLSVTRLPLFREVRGFAPPPRDEFALSLVRICTLAQLESNIHATRPLVYMPPGHSFVSYWPTLEKALDCVKHFAG
jgi:hypothetical protein